jgi:MFS transporter, DHA2 family, multidrug resistance protein
LSILLARKIDLRWLLMGGLASFALAMWSYSFITHDWGSDQLLLPQNLRGLPQVFALAPVVNLGLGSLPPDRLKFASGLFNMMRNLGIPPVSNALTRASKHVASGRR